MALFIIECKWCVVFVLSGGGACFYFFLTGFVPSGTSFLLISYFQELFFHCFNTGETYLSVFYISFAVNNEVGRNT